MARNFCVSEIVLCRTKLTKILCRARHHVIGQVKDDSPSRFQVDCDIELYGETMGYRQKCSEGMQREELWYARIHSIRPVYRIVLLSTVVQRDK
jgi:hypothetical protein